MLKKVSDFIVNKRYWILGAMLLAAICSVFMMQRVEINEDMTKYLPDDSAMKVGMDVMTEEFPEMEVMQTIRVMFDDLTGDQKEGILLELESIPYVDSVTHEDDSEDYNKDNHTLFVLNTEYDYGSQEELAIESTLDKEFAEYSLKWHNDDTSMPDIPAWIVAAALAILMVILFAMCGSWIEPVLFLVVIGIAIVINMGTNLIMGSVSSVTFSIAAILQLVLSMDYSIILINRYRQEKAQAEDNKQAMKAALANAFSSIASSSLTTVVGLLMLVFMSFKIGMDLGIVLAKGVFISMVCVLTMLPGIILVCDGLIQKTSKKELHIPMNWAAGFSYKLRHGLGILFVLLFAGVYWLQSQAGISYTLQSEDPVADIFPASNTLLMVYESRDEKAVSEIAAGLEKDENIKSVMAYSTMLAKPYTAAELAEEIEDMGEDFALDASVINMLYYDYFVGEQNALMTVSDFLNFVSGPVMENEAFADYIDEDIRDNIDMMKKFADADSLTTPMNAGELADFFDMDEGDIDDLLLFYYIEKGGVPTGNMTLAAFADFVINEVAKDETYGSLFDADTLKELEKLAVFTNASKMTTPYNYKRIVSMLDMDADMVRLLFVYYYALSDDYTPAGMTLPEFVHYLQNDIASDPTFGSAFDESALEQINMLAQFTDSDTLQKQMFPDELAGLMGMDESMVRQIFMMYFGTQRVDQGISLASFMDFLVNSVMENPDYAGFFGDDVKSQVQQMNRMVSAAAEGRALTSEELAAVFGMDGSMIQALFMYKAGADAENPVTSMTIQGFVDFLVNDIASNPAFASFLDASTIQQLTGLGQMINAAVSGVELDAQALASMTGMDAAMIQTLFIFKSSEGAEPIEEISFNDFLGFLQDEIMGNPVFSTQFDDDAKGQLEQLGSLLELAGLNVELPAEQLAEITGLTVEQVEAVLGSGTGNGQGDNEQTDHDTAEADSEGQEKSETEESESEEGKPAGNEQEEAEESNPEEGESSETVEEKEESEEAGAEEAEPESDGSEEEHPFRMLVAVEDSVSEEETDQGSDDGQEPEEPEEPVTATLMDFLNAALQSSELDDNTKARLGGMQQVIVMGNSGAPLQAGDLAAVLGMDESMIQLLLTYKAGMENPDPVESMESADFMNYILNDVAQNPVFSQFVDENALRQLSGLQQMINLAVQGTELDAQTLASITGMDESMIKMLFLFKTAQTVPAVDAMTLPDFLAFLINDISANPIFGSQFDSETIGQLKMLQGLVGLAASGEALTYQQMAEHLGMDEAQLRQLYILYWGRDISGKTLSLVQIIDFLLTDEMMSSSLDDATRQQLQFLKEIIEATLSGRIFGYEEMADLLGMDSSMVRMLYTYRESGYAADSWTLSMHTIINFLIDNSEQLGSVMGNEEIAQLKTAQKLINGSVNGISYSASALAELMGMDASQAEQLYLLYVSRHGDTSGWTLSVKGFIDFINSDILNNADFEDQFDQETADMLSAAQVLADAVISGKAYTSAQMSELFEGFSDELDLNTMELMYLYASSEKSSDPAWKMSMETLFSYLTDDVLVDPRFAELIDDEMRKELKEAQADLREGKEQLVTDRYSRMIITSDYPEESVETTAFLTDLMGRCKDELSGEFYFIGNSAMTYEMQQIFDRELILITMLTAIAIFLIVALTFKSVFIPLILVLVVQCGVYATISVVGLQGGSMYYLALLIVECILMGATIDYGILFTNYYCESRIVMPVNEALKAAYAGATHTILTSGLILILVTAIVGNFFEEPTVSAIVKTVSIGALSATLLIIFVLPGLLAVCDRFVVRRPKQREGKIES